MFVIPCFGLLYLIIQYLIYFLTNFHTETKFPLKQDTAKGMVDSIKVAVRLRAPSKREEDLSPIVQVVSGNTVLAKSVDQRGFSRNFHFDHCFSSSNDPEEDQEKLYDSLGREYLLHALDGYNTCIFAYGQTGSGKSHTMNGQPSAPGLIPRLCKDLFEVRDLLAPTKDGITVELNVKCSYLEIYNEQVRDLLAGQDANNSISNCRVRERLDRTTFVEGLQEFTVHTVDEILDLLEQGNEIRVTEATHVNDRSSRSHAIFTIALDQKEISPLGQVLERKSHIKLIDLAGSERASASGSKGERFKEGSKINKSLSSLGRVISMLAKKNKPKLIPYRDSALTWVLKESLGGNSKTCMIACISPCDYEETTSTLRYATIAKSVKTAAHVNSYETSEQKEQMELMKRQLNDLQETLSELKDQKAIQDQMEKIKLTNDFLEQRIKREREQTVEYYDQLVQASTERDQLTQVLLSIAGSIQNSDLSDLAPVIERLQTDSRILGSKIDSDLSFCNKISGLT